ncbi:MFS transporter [Micrococcales bacterium 31B]|nr:MFS transporter [Micrococcales bacterium 31B]
MRLDAFRSVLKVPGLRTLLIVGVFARIPLSAAPLVLTLHVTLTLGLDFFEAGIVAAAATVGSAISGPWRGHLVDKHGLRRALLPSVIVEVLFWGAAPSLPFVWLVGAGFIAGAFSLPVFTVLRQALGAMVRGPQRRAAYSLDSIGTELTFMLGPAVFAALASVVSTALAMYLIGASLVLSGIALMWINPPTRSVEGAVEGEDASSPDARATGPAYTAREFVRSGPGLAILAASACATFILTGTDVGIVAFHREQDIVPFVGVSIASWCLGSLIGGFVYGIMHRSRSPYVILLLLGLATIPIGLASSLWLLCVLAFLAGLFCAPMVTAASEAVAGMVREDSRGQAMGWQGTAYTVGGGIASPTVGLTIDHFGAHGAFIAAGAIGLVIAALGLGLGRIKRAKREIALDI